LSMSARVLVVDNHDDIRRLFMVWLEGEDGLKVVGGARDSKEAVKMLADTPAEVVLLDLDMPDAHALAAIRAVKKAYPEVRIVGMSWDQSSGRMARMLDAGARMMFDKAGKLDGLVRVIQKCME
jgi:DNA-binding NarL/FixJ family response regulator